jgi:hypothetical protein
MTIGHGRPEGETCAAGATDPVTWWPPVKPALSRPRPTNQITVDFGRMIGQPSQPTLEIPGTMPERKAWREYLRDA